ncbi:hypothetical protein ACWCXE_21115 [Streptomyces sp. NPDC001780]
MSDQTTAQWLRTAAERIARGSTRLCLVYARRTAMKIVAKGRSWWSGITGWLGEASGLAWLFQLVLLLIGALILRKVALGLLGGMAALVDSARWLLWPAAVVWIIAAYRVGHPDWTPPADTEPEDQPKEKKTEKEVEPEDGGDDQEQPANTEPVSLTKAEFPEPPLPSLQDIRETLARVGTPHAHISVLAEDLGTTPERIREALGKWDIPVESVRMRGRGSSTGIRGDRYPAPPPGQGTPSDGVVAAGQPANNNNDNAPTVVRREGMLIITDPADHHRHHTLTKD